MWCKWRNHVDFSRITSMGTSLEKGELIASPASLGQVEPCVGCFMSSESCVTSDRHHLKPPGSQPRCFGAKAWSTGRKWQGVETHRPSSWTFLSNSQSLLTARDEERVVAREGWSSHTWEVNSWTTCSCNNSGLHVWDSSSSDRHLRISFLCIFPACGFTEQGWLWKEKKKSSVDI